MSTPLPEPAGLNNALKMAWHGGNNKKNKKKSSSLRRERSGSVGSSVGSSYASSMASSQLLPALSTQHDGPQQQQMKKNAAAIELSRDKPLQAAIVQFSYKALQVNEIDLVPGEMLLAVTGVEGSGWLEGTKGSGDRGLFPANFVQLFPMAAEQQHHGREEMGVTDVEADEVHCVSPTCADAERMIKGALIPVGNRSGGGFFREAGRLVPHHISGANEGDTYQLQAYDNRTLTKFVHGAPENHIVVNDSRVINVNVANHHSNVTHHNSTTTNSTNDSVHTHSSSTAQTASPVDAAAVNVVFDERTPPTPSFPMSLLSQPIVRQLVLCAGVLGVCYLAMCYTINTIQTNLVEPLTSMVSKPVVGTMAVLSSVYTAGTASVSYIWSLAAAVRVPMWPGGGHGGVEPAVETDASVPPDGWSEPEDPAAEEASAGGGRGETIAGVLDVEFTARRDTTGLTDPSSLDRMVANMHTRQRRLSKELEPLFASSSSSSQQQKDCSCEQQHSDHTGVITDHSCPCASPGDSKMGHYYRALHRLAAFLSSSEAAHTTMAFTQATHAAAEAARGVEPMRRELADEERRFKRLAAGIKRQPASGFPTTVASGRGAGVNTASSSGASLWAGLPGWISAPVTGAWRLVVSWLRVVWSKPDSATSLHKTHHGRKEALPNTQATMIIGRLQTWSDLLIRARKHRASMRGDVTRVAEAAGKMDRLLRPAQHSAEEAMMAAGMADSEEHSGRHEDRRRQRGAAARGPPEDMFPCKSERSRAQQQQQQRRDGKGPVGIRIGVGVGVESSLELRLEEYEAATHVMGGWAAALKTRMDVLDRALEEEMVWLAEQREHVGLLLLQLRSEDDDGNDDGRQDVGGDDKDSLLLLLEGLEGQARLDVWERGILQGAREWVRMWQRLYEVL